MELWIVIYGVSILWVAINAAFYNLIERKTKYGGNTQGDRDMGAITYLALIFGPILLLFYKKVRLYRKHLYLKKRINYYIFSHDIMGMGSGLENPMQSEIDKLSRIYKISKMYQKTKWHKRIKILKWQ